MIDKCCNVVYNYFVIIICKDFSDKKSQAAFTSGLAQVVEFKL